MLNPTLSTHSLMFHPCSPLNCVTNFISCVWMTNLSELQVEKCSTFNWKVPHLCEVAAEQCLSDMEGSDLGHGAESISHSSLNQVHCIGPCRSDYFPFPFIESHPWMGRPWVLVGVQISWRPAEARPDLERQLKFILDRNLSQRFSVSTIWPPIEYLTR